MRRIAAGAVALMLSTPVFAGEFYAGVRSWQAEWSPGILHNVSEELNFTMFLNLLVGNKAYVFPAYLKNFGGFYSGPMLGYVTEDRKWSFNLVYLEGKSQPGGLTVAFLQEQAIASAPGAQVESIGLRTTQGRPLRRDTDFTAAYALTDRWKVFAGLKSQSYVFSLRESIIGAVDLFVTNETLADDYHTNFSGPGHLTIKNAYTGPVAGVGYAFPLSETGSLTTSAGYFDAAGTSDWSQALLFTNGRSIGAGGGYTRLEVRHRPTTMRLTGITYEILYTSKVNESVFLQAGFRGQRSTMDFDQTLENFEYVWDNGVSSGLVLPNQGKKYSDGFHGYSVNILIRL